MSPSTCALQIFFRLASLGLEHRTSLCKSKCHMSEGPTQRQIGSRWSVMSVGNKKKKTTCQYVSVTCLRIALLCLRPFSSLKESVAKAHFLFLCSFTLFLAASANPEPIFDSKVPDQLSASPRRGCQGHVEDSGGRAEHRRGTCFCFGLCPLTHFQTFRLPVNPSTLSLHSLSASRLIAWTETFWQTWI